MILGWPGGAAGRRFALSLQGYNEAATAFPAPSARAVDVIKEPDRVLEAETGPIDLDV